MENTPPRIRKFVSDMYHNDTWRQKVSKMSDQQVYAIYCKEQAKPIKLPTKKDPDFHQYKIESDGRIV